MGRSLAAIVAALAAASTAVGVAAKPDADAAAASCAPKWASMRAPAIAEALLFDVVARTPEDVWAVGFVGDVYDQRQETWVETTPLIQHWDGRQWTVTRLPEAPGRLRAVAAMAANDVWAVGAQDDASGPAAFGAGRALATHWDGTTWTVVEVPASEQLYDVSLTSATDGWAVGFVYVEGEGDEYGEFHGVILHWDGRAWARVATPRVALSAVVAIARDDVWAVGENAVVHWDGSAWTTRRIPRVPDAGVGSVWLGAVAAASARNVWAVGDGSRDETTHTFLPVAAQWDGSRWRNRPPPTYSFSVYGVAFRTPRDLWLAGTDNDEYMFSDTLSGSALWRRVGTTWRRTRLAAGRVVLALDADSNRALWGVGYIGRGKEPGSGFERHMTPFVTRYAC